MKENKEMNQKWLLEALSTEKGRMLCRIYYRGALFRLEKTVTMEGMIKVLCINDKSVKSQGNGLYIKGQKMRVPAVDQWLQNGYEGFRSGLLCCSEEEQKLLKSMGSSAYLFEKVCRSK